MALSTISLGTSPEGTGGDSVREAFTKVNENFAGLVTTFNVTAVGTAIAVPFIFATARAAEVDPFYRAWARDVLRVVGS
jgi:uncharacterized protein YqgV (UPF0045/DUF77 family)